MFLFRFFGYATFFVAFLMAISACVLDLYAEAFKPSWGKDVTLDARSRGLLYLAALAMSLLSIWIGGGFSG